MESNFVKIISVFDIDAFELVAVFWVIMVRIESIGTE